MRCSGRLGLAVAVVVLAVPSSASALANFTWSGASTNHGWSDGTNWVGGTSPSGSVGTLTFPTLTNPACMTNPPPDACGSSDNDISGLTASALSFDSSGPYTIQGNGITLGGGGLSATAPTSPGGPTFDLDFPIVLSAPQTWTIGGNGSNVLLSQGVSGTGEAVTANLTSATGLSFGGDAEIGTFSAVGSDSSRTGNNAGMNGAVTLDGGGLNGTDGNAVNLTDVLFTVGASASVGPLTSTGAEMVITASEFGSGMTSPILTVNGGVTLDSNTVTQMDIAAPGTTAGDDYSQLSGTGAVSLSGGLDLFAFGESGCPMLHVGDVDTLITTTGALSGSFNGVPDGTAVEVCGPSGPTVRVNYTAHAMTATVLTAGAPSSSTSLTANPSNPVTNQPVTLTATITAASGTPSGGTVEFDDVDGPITGCDAQPVSWSGTTGTATCHTSFAASSSPEELFAGFAPTNASVQASGAGPVRLSIGQDSTATALAASNASPSTGQSVTYTATVTPNDAGPAEPSGTVQFQDGGSTISGCRAQPLTAAASASTATCTVSYASAASHSITAVYSGDANFAGSTSPAPTVTVQSPTPNPTPTPAPTPTPPGPTGPSASQILSAVSSALAPHGKGATIGALLSHGGYAFTFTAPGAGTLTINWYFLPPGAHLSTAHKAKPVVIASARVTFGKAGAAHVTVRLTAAGKRMLKHAKTLGLVSKAGFQPTGAAATTKTKRFTLKR